MILIHSHTLWELQAYPLLSLPEAPTCPPSYSLYSYSLSSCLSSSPLTLFTHFLSFPSPFIISRFSFLFPLHLPSFSYLNLHTFIPYNCFEIFYSSPSTLHLLLSFFSFHFFLLLYSFDSIPSFLLCSLKTFLFLC